MPLAEAKTNIKEKIREKKKRISLVIFTWNAWYILKSKK